MTDTISVKVIFSQLSIVEVIPLFIDEVYKRAASSVAFCFILQMMFYPYVRGLLVSLTYAHHAAIAALVGIVVCWLIWLEPWSDSQLHAAYIKDNFGASCNV